MLKQSRKPWFSYKRHGYGAGLPITIEGWIVLALYFVATFLAATAVPLSYGFPLLLVINIAFIAIAARRTAGGWKWRNRETNRHKR
ncbi:MAG: hypothetical protein E6R12_10930 [Sphingomonadales bacterium]|nr:MAG: hypothetical protein E6R12_10930 [Sphingomonadales bacterium]